jgi:hypothetical protein
MKAQSRYSSTLFHQYDLVLQAKALLDVLSQAKAVKPEYPVAKRDRLYAKALTRYKRRLDCLVLFFRDHQGSA